jgi:hypothetical protein
MGEELSRHSQPTVGISDKPILVIDLCRNLKIQVLHVIGFSRCYGLDFPLIAACHGDADERNHLVPFPLDEDEGVPVADQLRNLTDL